ncbi:MAG: 30S ribosomal protein S4 [Alphaproteobacteria bacterium]|jgi:small subunit ribosomal protein S4|nr:30S ribosomal protein S4 [Alphaproteobacteria bacterium]MBN9566971.1 30S ribosomal protein S4 [Alphaproteobacteria bacterium]MBN9570994.1 30S ribosomal protein S4 [Alphaproteobacteria bacterium]MBN9578777.1 30S ribosomal protein S4 [Alphaproteobacteria bacterium]OJU56879.1 MAG: 30S ribosomal protein S4 [Alphaproteobacteria bacterium 62-8]
MSKRSTSKYKLDRRMGESVWGRPKSPVNKRSYGPGQHGQRRAKKLSDYGTQLQAKQKLKGYYGNITEKQFRRYYQEAVRKPGDTGENMIGLLERRLDAVVYRAKFVPTPFAARQLVSHGHVKVNGRRVTVASFLVKEGDLVELTAKARDMALVIEAAKSAERDTPDYIDADHGKMAAKFLRTPKLGDVPYAAQMQPSLVVEFYSR